MAEKEDLKFESVEWKKVDATRLQEILRLSELQMQSQLTTALSADQRATALSGILATATIASFGASGAFFMQSGPNLALAWALLASALTAYLGTYYGFRAAKAIPFYFPGNELSSYLSEDDLFGDQSKALAEQAKHYDERIIANRKSMEANGKLFNCAIRCALVSPIWALLGALASGRV